MNDAHFEFWPRRVPRTLTLPETNVFHNLAVSADRYPAKAAIVYYGNEVSYRRLRADTEALAGIPSKRPRRREGRPRPAVHAE